MISVKSKTEWAIEVPTDGYTRQSVALTIVPDRLRPENKVRVGLVFPGQTEPLYVTREDLEAAVKALLTRPECQ